MRKILSILLVAILAASTAFAAFSGEASLGFGGNLDNGNFGFIDKTAKVKVDVDVATASAEAIADGSVYASIKATLGLGLYNGEKGSAESGDPSIVGGPYKLGVIADITEAKVAGENWYVSILGVPGGPDYAKSAIDTYDAEGIYDKWGFVKEDYSEPYTYAAAYNKVTGVEVGVYDYKLGFGLLGDYSKADTWELKDNLNLTAYAETPEYEFVEGLTTKAGIVYSYKSFEELNDGVVTGQIVDDKAKTSSLGLSAKVGYVKDALSVSVASDLGFALNKEGEDVFNADVAATVAYDFVTFDAYYATAAKAGIGNKMVEDTIVGILEDDSVGLVTISRPTGDTRTTVTKDDYLSAQVKTDLNSFNVPVALTVALKDIIAKQQLSVKAEVTAIEGLKITANAGYTFTENGRTNDGTRVDVGNAGYGKWSTGASVEYDLQVATIKGGVSVECTTQDGAEAKIGANLSAETSALIPGATLKLAWAGDDLTDKHRGDHDNGNLGKVTASCKITF